MHQNKLCNIGTLFRIISSNMLSHWYLHLIAFFLHYSWVASYRNFLLNYLYFSSVYFFTIEQNIFFYIKTQCYFLLTCTCNSLPKDICAAHFHKLYDIHKYHRVFMMCMQQFSKLRRFLFWNAPSKLSDFNTHRANNKIKRLKGSLRCKPLESTRMIMLTNCARCLEYFQVEKRCQHSTIPIINFHKEFFFSGWK